MNRRNFIQLTATGAAGSLLLTSNNLFGAEAAAVVSKPGGARYIWYDAVGQGRNLYGLFRKTVTLTGEIKSAVIHLFADTAYQLFVNGQYVEFGPVRFDPRFPMFDSIDIAPFLIKGKNVIAVQSNYFGCKTYKSIPAGAGMVAWGDIKTSKETVSLQTSAKSGWKCKPTSQRPLFTQKMTFVLNPFDLVVEDLAETNWTKADFDDTQWPVAVELTRQDAWGTLAPRNIPFMSGKILDSPQLTRILPLQDSEEQHSFTLPIPHFYEDNSREYAGFIAYSYWVYSPEDQDVTVGVFWGESWLNGIPIERGFEPPHQCLRINQLWSLKRGWNYLFGKVGAYSDALNYYVAFPADKGIKISANKDLSSPYKFKHSPVLTAREYEQTLKNKLLPYAETDTLSEVGGWKYVGADQRAQSPVYETSWDNYGAPFELISFDKLSSHTFRKSVYADGFAILFDFNEVHLAFPQLEIAGVKGATIDLTYCEHLAEDMVHFNHTHQQLTGDRMICASDRVRFMPSQPRGVRYVKLTVRNTAGDVSISSLTFRSANYPVEAKGRFTCSDALLTNIWSMSQRTQAIDMEDAYVDCVTRERGMYARDAIIQYHNNLATFGDQKLFNRCLQLYGQSPDATGKLRAVFPNTGDYTISDFSLNLVEGYRAYYEHSGDKQRISDDWTAIMGNLAWFNELADEQPDLLLDSEWDKKRNIKAHYGGFHGDLGIVRGYQDNTGLHCVFTCTYLIALKDAYKLALAIDKKKDAAELKRRIDILQQAIPARFWDNNKKAYADNTQFTTHSHHASIFAARAGVVTPSQLDDVRKHVSWELRSIFKNGYDPEQGVYFSPAFAFYIFDGLYRLGLPQVAENAIRQAWGWCLMKGMRNTPEYFDLSPSQSMSHAWSASPAYFMSKYILGVTYPQAPDYSKVSIDVRTSVVQQAEGSYPHPDGVVEVKWHMENGKRIFDLIKVPKGVTVDILG